MAELERLKQSIEAHRATANAQLIEAQNSYNAAVAAKDNDLTTAMENIDPLEAATQADIDELTDVISQLDIIRGKFEAVQAKQEEAMALTDGIEDQVQVAK